MDKTLPERILELVNAVATGALKVPPDQTKDLVRRLVAEFRKDFAVEYAGDEQRMKVAAEFADNIEELTLAQLAILEVPGGHIGNA